MRLFGFFGLPELLDQSGPLLRRSLGDGRHGFLCGFDAAGQDFLFDAWRSFFCGVYAFSKEFRPFYTARTNIVFIGKYIYQEAADSIFKVRQLWACPQLLGRPLFFTKCPNSYSTFDNIKAHKDILQILKCVLTCKI